MQLRLWSSNHRHLKLKKFDVVVAIVVCLRPFSKIVEELAMIYISLQNLFLWNNLFVYCRRSCLYDESSDLSWPFQELEGLDHGDIRETAYEILFTACRSSPGFGGRSAITFYSKHDGNSDGKSPGVTQTSKMKLALGLKMMRSSLSQRVMVSTTASTPASPVTERSPRSRSVPRRAMTMAEVMRLQMGVSEQS